jgi:serine protease Do
VDAAEAVATALLPSIVKVATRSARFAGAGSGVIYTSDGYIITNDHVVQGATTVTVQLHTGEVVPARVVGSAAPLVDIAVLKIDRRGLKAAKFGSSRELKLGELAVAIGNPLGLEASVSAGVVSGVHRNGSVGRARFLDAVQTDAPLQPGNSGGALANADAEVIGINTLVIGDMDAGQGIGLAISADTVRNVAEQIIDRGSARLAFIGINGEDAPGGGVMVLSLISGGPADAAGLQPGDIVRSFDGARVTSMDGLVSALLQKSVGQVADLQIERDGSRRTVKVKLQARDAP